MGMVMTTTNFMEYRDMLKEQHSEAYSEWMKNSERLDEMTDEEKRDHARLFGDWFDLEESIHQMECEHLNGNEELMKAIHKMCYQKALDVRQWVQEKMDGCYEEYERLRKDGLSFQERAKSIDLEKVEKYEEYLKTPAPSFNDIVVRPAQCWLPQGDGYDKLKEIGIVEFFKSNNMFMYDNKKYNNE